MYTQTLFDVAVKAACVDTWNSTMDITYHTLSTLFMTWYTYLWYAYILGAASIVHCLVCCCRNVKLLCVSCTHVQHTKAQLRFGFQLSQCRARVSALHDGPLTGKKAHPRNTHNDNDSHTLRTHTITQRGLPKYVILKQPMAPRCTCASTLWNMLIIWLLHKN